MPMHVSGMSTDNLKSSELETCRDSESRQNWLVVGGSGSFFIASVSAELMAEAGFEHAAI